MRLSIITLSLAAGIFTNCSSFIIDEQLSELKKFENNIYIIKKDLTIGSRKLKKEDDIRILITESGDWIKVEGYLAKIGKLKAERLQLLYMFEEDFPDEKFDVKLFKKKLFEIVDIKK